MSKEREKKSSFGLFIINIYSIFFKRVSFLFESDLKLKITINSLIWC